MKKFIPVALLLTTILFSSCANPEKTPYVSVSYGGQNALFPAVYQALKNIKQNIYIESADIYGKEYITSYYYHKDLFKNIRFKLKIRKNEINAILVDLVEMEEQSTEAMPWTASTSTYTFDKNKFRNTIIDDIYLLLTDNSAYEAALSTALSDLNFLYSIFNDMTEVATKFWVNKYLVNREVKWSMPLMNFRKNNNRRMKEYKYEAVFTILGIKQGAKSRVFSKDIFLSYYTNNDDFAKMKVGTNVPLRGKFISLEDTITSRLYMHINVTEL